MASPTRSVRAFVVALSACAAVLLSGCASEVSGTAVAISGASIPTTTTPPRTTTGSPTPDIDEGGSVDIDVTKETVEHLDRLVRASGHSPRKVLLRRGRTTMPLADHRYYRWYQKRAPAFVFASPQRRARPA